MSNDEGRIEAACQELKKILLSLMPEEGVINSPIPTVGIGRRNRAGIVEHRFDRPLASLLVQGMKKTCIGLQEYLLLPRTVLIVGIDMPSSSHIIEASPENPLLAIFFHIDRKIVDDLLWKLDKRFQLAPHSLGSCVETASADFIEDMLKLARIMDQPEQIPVRAELVLRDLHYLLLTGPQAPTLYEIYNGDRYTGHLFAAIDYLKAHLDCQVSSSELSKVACMSGSTLYRNFKTLTGLSPLQYHKQLRLHEARRLIFSENEQAAITAQKVGYESVTQFTREYKRLFGQPPYRSKKIAGKCHV